MSQPIGQNSSAIALPLILDSTNTNWFAIKDSVPGNAANATKEELIIAQGVAHSSGTIPKTAIPAIIPSTILNTLLHNPAWVKENIGKDAFKDQPGSGDFYDPFFDNNLSQIPDIHQEGVAFYTYWFATSVKLTPVVSGGKVWLNLRGINYSADVFVNGKRPGNSSVQGMFLRNACDITHCLSSDGTANIAIRVEPPKPAGYQPVGGRNGGVDGATNIANSVTMRYPVGWDWIQSIPDRSSGIWDQVSISYTQSLVLKDPEVKTTVLEGGKLRADKSALVDVIAEVFNPTKESLEAYVKLTIDGQEQSVKVAVGAGCTEPASFPQVSIANTRLWWPHGTDPAGIENTPQLYELNLAVYQSPDLDEPSLSDQKMLKIGMREYSQNADYQLIAPPTGSPMIGRQFLVNGTPVFIRGGNWMGTDALFRGNAQRYHHEVRMHREMNLNMIRVWGGALIERSEFYEACDELGIMVMQEFWFSSEFKFPDNDIPKIYQAVFTRSAQDCIRMLRNHASLMFWSAANESVPPEPLLSQLQSYICTVSNEKTVLDHTRLLVTNSLALSGEAGTDGPYGILPLNSYFNWLPYNGDPRVPRWHNSFNPEVGSLGLPTAESMELVLNPDNLKDFPKEYGVQLTDPNHPDWPAVNDTWAFLKYSQYFINYPDPTQPDDQIYTYGTPADIKGFCDRAQLASYMHYKGLFEGYMSHMWTYYTGLNIWKSQGPWTGLRAKLYDWFLESTGGYWGTRNACEQVHVQLDLSGYPAGRVYDVIVVNHTTADLKGLTLNWEVFGLEGSLGGNRFEIPSTGQGAVAASRATSVHQIDLTAALLPADTSVYFVILTLSSGTDTVSRNMYWLSKDGSFKALDTYDNPVLSGHATGKKRTEDNYEIQAVFENSSSKLSFWNRLQIRKPGATAERVLPVFYDQNYFSVTSGSPLEVNIDFQCPDIQSGQYPELWLQGWNQDWMKVDVDWG